MSDAEKTICVVGCGHGDRVKTLRDDGHDAYGIDIDDRVIASGDPRAIPYLYMADAENPEDWDWVVDTTGVGDDGFDLIITERCVSCFDDPEDTCELLRSHAEQVRHEIAAIAPVYDPGLTPLTPGEWRSRCDPSGNDEWIDAMR